MPWPDYNGNLLTDITPKPSQQSNSTLKWNIVIRQVWSEISELHQYEQGKLCLWKIVYILKSTSNIEDRIKSTMYIFFMMIYWRVLLCLSNEDFFHQESVFLMDEWDWLFKKYISSSPLSVLFVSGQIYQWTEKSSRIHSWTGKKHKLMLSWIFIVSSSIFHTTGGSIH